MKMVPLSLWPPGISVEPRIPTPNTVLPVLHTGPNLASIELQEQGPENLSLPPGKKYNRMLGGQNKVHCEDQPIFSSFLQLAGVGWEHFLGSFRICV